MRKPCVRTAAVDKTQRTHGTSAQRDCAQDISSTGHPITCLAVLSWTRQFGPLLHKARSTVTACWSESATASQHDGRTTWMATISVTFPCVTTPGENMKQAITLEDHKECSTTSPIFYVCRSDQALCGHEDPGCRPGGPDNRIGACCYHLRTEPAKLVNREFSHH